MVVVGGGCLMALIKCPECGKEISNRAHVCIHCGYPLEENESSQAKPKKERKKMKRSVKEGLFVFGGFAVAITLFVLFLKWNDDVFVGTIWDEVIPAVMIGLLVAWMVLLIVSNLFKYRSVLWWISSGSAFAITVAYRLLHLNETLGIYIFIGLAGVLLLMVLIKWIADAVH